MTEKVKIVIEYYFLLPDFKSRGHPTLSTSSMKYVTYKFCFLLHRRRLQLQTITKNILTRITPSLNPPIAESPLIALGRNYGCI